MSVYRSETHHPTEIVRFPKEPPAQNRARSTTPSRSPPADHLRTPLLVLAQTIDRRKPLIHITLAMILPIFHNHPNGWLAISDPFVASYASQLTYTTSTKTVCLPQRLSPLRDTTNDPFRRTTLAPSRAPITAHNRGSASTELRKNHPPRKRRSRPNARVCNDSNPIHSNRLFKLHLQCPPKTTKRSYIHALRKLRPPSAQINRGTHAVPASDHGQPLHDCPILRRPPAPPFIDTLA